VSVISAQPVDQQTGSESDPAHGADAYSLQDNVFFKGTNKQQDGDQFTDQSAPALGVDLNGVCVWQVDIKTQHYTPTCESFLGGYVGLVEGTVEDGLLTAAASGGTVTAVVADDLYGLGKGDDGTTAAARSSGTAADWRRCSVAPKRPSPWRSRAA
jgi:hypothetical protein